MNRFKNVFCLFLFIVSFIYSRTLFNSIDIIDSLLKKDKLFFITTITNKRFNDPVSLLDVQNKSVSVKKEQIVNSTTNNTNDTNKKPKIYIFNSHQKEEYKSNFILEASETVYKYIELNVYNDRTQVLPIVKSVDIKSINTTTYKYKDVSDSKAYKAVVTVAYEKDLGYPTQVLLVLIHNEDKLEIAKMETL